MKIKEPNPIKDKNINGSWSTLEMAKNTIKQLKNDQFFQSLAGFKLSQKVAIFSKVKEKGYT